MARWLTELCGASPEVIAVGIEVPRGPFVESLLEGGFCVHSLTPRGSLTASGTASAPREPRMTEETAQVLASALRTDRSSSRHVEPQNPDIITLRELNRTREELVGERTRLVNRLRELLWRYYPQFNELMGTALRPWHLELWALAPEFAIANRARVSTVRKLLRRHRIRRLGAEEVLEMLRSEEMNIGETTVTSCVWRVRMIIKRMKVLDALLKEMEVSIREMIKTIDSKQALRDGEPTDVEILRFIPGVGDVVLATLLSEAWGPICRRDREALRCLGATAPVTKQSGETRYVVRRQSVCARLRDVLHVMGGAAAIWDPVSRAKYRSLRDRGLGYYRSVRTVANRLLLVACALLEKRELFDKDFKKLPQEVAA